MLPGQRGGTANDEAPSLIDRAIYRTRNRVECMINCFEQFRRLATRYETRAEYCRAMWIIATIPLEL